MEEAGERENAKLKRGDKIEDDDEELALAHVALVVDAFSGVEPAPSSTVIVRESNSPSSLGMEEGRRSVTEVGVVRSSIGAG